MANINWRHIEIFHAVMTSGNPTQAAALLHTSQPTVSRELARLEQQLGLTLFEHGLVSRELGRTPIGHYTFNCQAPDAGNMEILIEHGTAVQKEQFLMPLLRGEIRSCFSMTEPEYAGSNPVMMGTTAVREGDSYIIDGHKWFTSSADGASFAVVMAITNPHAENKHLRASQIIVPMMTGQWPQM